MSRLSATGGTRVCGPGLTAAAGEVHVTVDQPGNDPPPAEVVLLAPRHSRSPARSRPIQSDALAGDEQMHAAARLGVVQLGVQEEVSDMGEKLPPATGRVEPEEIA